MKKVAMCSKCKRKGSMDKPLIVIGNDEDRVSACCRAKVLLVDADGVIDKLFGKFVEDLQEFQNFGVKSKVIIRTNQLESEIGEKIKKILKEEIELAEGNFYSSVDGALKVVYMRIFHPEQLKTKTQKELKSLVKNKKGN